jgi:hypothetical protein
MVITLQILNNNKGVTNVDHSTLKIMQVMLHHTAVHDPESLYNDYDDFILDVLELIRFLITFVSRSKCRQIHETYDKYHILGRSTLIKVITS